MPNLTHDQEVLFTRQRHEADRAGLHYDYRIVVGDKAYSWATRKELPEPGKSILLHEQPVHTASYALSKRVEIPKGQYGAGVTVLDWVSKGKIYNPTEKKDHFSVHLNDGQRFLVKKLPEKYGKKAWLFRNLTTTDQQEKKASNRYLEKISQQLVEPAHPENLGINLASGEEAELNKWLIAVTLFSRPIQRSVATKAYKQLTSEGIYSPESIQAAEWGGLRDALVRGHYSRFDESTATTLLAQAKHLKEKYGTLTNLLDNRSPEEIRTEIQTFRGIGPLGSKLFVEGVKPHLNTFYKDKAMNKYLQKIASDLEIAKEYEKAEKHDISKYTKALSEVKNPDLKSAIKYALPQERQHAAHFAAAVKKETK